MGYMPDADDEPRFEERDTEKMTPLPPAGSEASGGGARQRRPTPHDPERDRFLSALAAKVEAERARRRGLEDE